MPTLPANCAKPNRHAYIQVECTGLMRAGHIAERKEDSMPTTLEGKVVIVTGSGGGIGAVIADRFAKEGARVVVSDRHRGAAEAVASRIPGAIAIPADVTREQDVSALIERTVEEHGALHHVVANAGIISASHPIAETPLDVWRSTMSVNLDGVFLTIKHSAAAIANSGGGSILTLSSISGTGAHLSQRLTGRRKLQFATSLQQLQVNSEHRKSELTPWCPATLIHRSLPLKSRFGSRPWASPLAVSLR